MIVVCDKCKTKYKLDERSIGRPRVKAQCARCEHVFVVQLRKAEEPPKVVLTKDSVVPEKPPAPTCQVITICNQKGGVAKTSTCLNLGASLALLKKRVLLVDFDVQANLSMLLGFQNARSFFEVLHSEEEKLSKFILKTKSKMFLLPSNSKMALLSKKHLQEDDFEYLLRSKLEEMKAHFDFILIDTPPSGDFYTLNALLASDLAIVPTQAEFLSMNGVEHIHKMVSVVKDKTDHALELKILITMYNSANTASRAVLERLKGMYGKRILNTAIEFDPKLQESQIVHSPVIYYDKESRSGGQYLEVARHLTDG